MDAERHVTVAQRRARLVARHHLGRTAADVVEAVRALVALHSTDPVTPHLALWARVAGYETSNLDDALCVRRALWRLHAMRRTLFIVPAFEQPLFAGAAACAVARKERKRVEQWLAAERPSAGVSSWLADLEERTLAAVRACGEATTPELTRMVPELTTEVTLGSGKWATRSPLSSRLLFLLAMDGRIVRTRPAGTWRSSQYRWASAREWFGHGDRADETLDEAEARAELARRYLAAYGPVTTIDVRWWTGWTARQSTAALDAAGAVPVTLDGGAAAWLLPGDADPPADDAPVVALLPGLDPTPMGWKERDWYLGTHAGRLFDRNGNVGPSVWVDGRVVGGWAQRPDGEVVTGLLEAVDGEAEARIAAEAAALGAWLDGTVVSTRFPVPYERELSGR